MYTKDGIQKIIQEFQQSEFISLKRGTTKALIEVNKRWSGLMSSTKVLTYWINHCKDVGFIDTLFCNECQSFMNNKVKDFPKYCSKECRSKNHNWRKDSESRKQLEQFWQEKYGCKNPFGNKEIRKKIKATNLERYGAEHNWGKNSIVWDKIKQTNLEKYGFEYQVQSENFKKKFKQTCIEHYGVEHPMFSDEVKNKLKKTNLERYGTENVWCAGSPIIEHNIETNLERYGVPYFCMTEKCKDSLNNLISKINRNFKEQLDKIGIDSVFEKQVGWFSYDLFIKSQNLLIDINPSFTHSSTEGVSNFKPKCKEYHYNRYKNAVVNGYKLIQIWDWDDTNKIIENLKPRKIIGARKCEIQEISVKDATNFCNQYHYQNSVKGITHTYGLFYDNELSQIMVFGKPRYNSNFDYELLRLCTKSEYKIIGGSERLLKYFEEQVKPKSIISYCDLSKFNGDVYEKLGFTEDSYAISKHWYNYKNHKHFTDNLLRQLGADKLIGTNYGKGTNNKEIMLTECYIEIYDAGQKTFCKYFK